MGMLCRLLGHKWPDAGRRLRHYGAPSEALVELTADCSRCGKSLHVGWYRRPAEWNTLTPTGKIISGLGMHEGRPTDMRQLHASPVHPQDLNKSFSSKSGDAGVTTNASTPASSSDSDSLVTALMVNALSPSAPAPEICRAEPYSSGGGGDFGGGGASDSWSSDFSSSSDSSSSSSSSSSD